MRRLALAVMFACEVVPIDALAAEAGTGGDVQAASVLRLDERRREQGAVGGYLGARAFSGVTMFPSARPLWAQAEIGWLGFLKGPNNVGAAWAALGVRGAPLGESDKITLYLETDLGVAFTGPLVRPLWDVGVAADTTIGAIRMGGFLKYMRIVAGGKPAAGPDAQMLVLGVSGGLKAEPARMAEFDRPVGTGERDGGMISEPATKPCPVAQGEQQRPAGGDAGPPAMKATSISFSERADLIDATLLLLDRYSPEGGPPSLVLPTKIYFPHGEASLSYGDRLLLHHIARSLRAHEQIKRLRIEGHTDVSGPEMPNKDLATERARAVASLLTGLGVQPSRLEVVGLGASQPVTGEPSKEARRLNRRVELVIIGIDHNPP